MRRSLQLGMSALAACVLLVATAGVISARTLHTVYMQVNKPSHGARHHGSGSNLSYHGGAIDQSAVVYIDYWGAQWAGSGFSTGGYSSSTAQTYVQDFFTNVGGSPWANSTTQYCSGVATGTTQCGSAGTHPLNPNGQLGGVWNDNVALPGSITQSAIQAEAARAEAHFGFNADANYMVFTPSGHSQSGFATSWCAYHGSTGSSGGTISYSYMPYQPDAGTNCGMNFVNPSVSDNPFGNGYFDGFSIVGGHEYGETITDPFPSSGWLDGSGAENGDKCAWITAGHQGAAANISLGGNSFAVQSLWSNAFNSGAGGCVLFY